MKTLRLFLLLLLPLVGASCDKEDDSIDLTDYRQDIVTCRHDGERLLFLRDDGATLCPDPALPAEMLPEEQRILIGYSPAGPTDDSHIRIVMQSAIGLIPYSPVTALDESEAALLADDPLYITSVWYGGGCINLRYQIEYHRATHSMSMIAVQPQADADTLDLQLRYNNSDDDPGFYRAGYASFRIESPHPANIRVRTNTANLGGEKYFVFTTKQ